MTTRAHLKDYLTPGAHRYYRGELPARLRPEYDILLDGYLSRQNDIVLRISDGDDLDAVSGAVLLDTPELFYVKKGGTYSENKAAGETTLHAQYRFDVRSCLDLSEAIVRRTEPFIRRTATLPDMQKAKAIHDFIIDGVVYRDPDAPYSHEAPGALIYGLGVCEGISKAFTYLADRVGLRSLAVLGTSIDAPGDDIPQGINHEWNIAFIDQRPYHIDVTWDLPSSDNVIRYDYFLLSDAQIGNRHVFVRPPHPECGDDFEYYRFIGRYASGKSVFQNLVRNHLHPGEPLVVKMPNLTDDVSDVQSALRDIATRTLDDTGVPWHSMHTTYDSDRMVFQFSIQ